MTNIGILSWGAKTAKDLRLTQHTDVFRTSPVFGCGSVAQALLQCVDICKGDLGVRRSLALLQRIPL